MPEQVMTVMVVPFDSNPGALFVGLREIRTDRVVLLHHEHAKSVESVAADLDKFKVSHESIPLSQISLDEVFRVFSELRAKYKESNLVVNLGCSDKVFTSVTLSAAFVNGLQAFDVVGDKVEPLPILKFEYSRMLSDKKLALLKKISEEKEYPSLESLAKSAGMSLPLVSYYVRGMKENEGLVQMGLVEVIESGGKLKVSASPLGKLLLKGYGPAKPVDNKKHLTLK